MKNELNYTYGQRLMDPSWNTLFAAESIELKQKFADLADMIAEALNKKQQSILEGYGTAVADEVLQLDADLAIVKALFDNAMMHLLDAKHSAVAMLKIT